MSGGDAPGGAALAQAAHLAEVRSALEFMRDGGDRPGMYESAERALKALDALDREQRAATDRLMYVLGEAREFVGDEDWSTAAPIWQATVLAAIDAVTRADSSSVGAPGVSRG